MDNLNTHNVWAVKIFITEIIYFLNVLLNLYFIDVFLGELADYLDPQRNVNSIKHFKLQMASFGSTGSRLPR